MAAIVASLINGVCCELWIFATNYDRSAPFVVCGKPRPSTVDTSPALLTQRELLIEKAAENLGADVFVARQFVHLASRLRLLCKHSVSFRQGCVARRLGTGWMGLGGWVRAGVVLREDGLVVPGHRVGRIRGDGRGVAL